MMRVGHGIDAHRFGGPGPVIVCGVVVDDTRGVEATSDGDVAAHAVTDAVLGAAALGDIGMLAPVGDPESADADSLGLLGRAVAAAVDAGFRLVNVDVTVVAQTVYVSPFRDEMRQRLAGAMALGVEAVSVKATTTDGLGFLGRDDGIAALATVTLATSQPE